MSKAQDKANALMSDRDFYASQYGIHKAAVQGSNSISHNSSIKDDQYLGGPGQVAPLTILARLLRVCRLHGQLEVQRIRMNRKASCQDFQLRSTHDGEIRNIVPYKAIINRYVPNWSTRCPIISRSSSSTTDINPHKPSILETRHR